MHLLFHMVYAAHAGGTHDRLALDALRHLGCPDARRWQRLFLAHAGLYLEGARASDSDAAGGAPEPATSWYTHVVEALAVADWPTAVYCAGVLSRRVMDPVGTSRAARSGGPALAGVLGRAIAESRAIAPEAGLGLATLLAAARAPGRMLARCRAAQRGGEVSAAGEAGLPDPSAGPTGRVVLFAPRGRVAQTGRTREADRQAGAEVIPLRRPAPPPVAPPAQALAATSNVTRQPMLYLVPAEAGRGRPLDEGPRLVWKR